MEQEFRRGKMWKDDKGIEVCSETIYRETNDIIDELWESGPAVRAGLTRDEVRALRFYTGPAYKPINGFLRALQDERARHTTLDEENTWASTVRNICQAFFKLSKSGECSQAKETFRGINGRLPDNFFVNDDKGMVSYMEFGLSSTSCDEEVIDDFIDGTKPNLRITVL